MNSDEKKFICMAAESWNLSTGSDDCAEDGCAGTSPWCRLYLMRAPSYGHVRRFLGTHPESIIACIDGSRADIYAQSILDDAPVTAHGVSWQTPELWQIGGNYIGFAFALDRRFGHRRLETHFVREFRRQIAILAESWTGSVRKEQRYPFALNTLLRLLFVSFLADRGTLSRRPRFIYEEADACVRCGRSIYRTLLAPLFFETLNRSEKHRTKRARSLGDIPFLNGGLFTPTEDEKTVDDLDAPNEIWMHILTDLFAPYAFHPSPDRIQTARIDPWMLGHIFEMLMLGEQRTATGSYYTPIPIARRIVRQTLVSWLHNKFGLCQSDIDHLLDHHQNIDIPTETAAAINDAVTHLTILDPACGSGAFLQCAHDEIHHLRTKLARYLGIPVHPGALAAQILTTNLYGIDILPTACQICELRLWLELIRYYQEGEQLPPLPNLDLNIQCGNSVIDLSQFCRYLGIEHSAMPPELDHLKRRYRRSTGYAKKRLSMRIQKLVSQAGRRIISHIASRYDDEITAVRAAGSQLFHREKALNSAQKARLRQIALQRRCLETAISHDMPFSLDLQFGDIFKKGGFDMIIGNPPWYSLHKMPAEIRQLLRTLYRTAVPEHGSSPGTQSADISALFVEKSIQCAKPDGMISMLLPNKLFSAPSYENFRRYIDEHTRILLTHDWSDSPHNVFHAAAYPASVLLQRRSPGRIPPYSADAARHELCRTCAISAAPCAGPDMGSKFSVKRGICTGGNDIFIGTPAAGMPDSTELCAMHFAASDDGLPVPIESALIRPVLRGAEIRAFRTEPRQQIVFTHETLCPGMPIRELPAYAKSWISRFESRLTLHKPAGRRPYYAFGGVSGLLLQPKVVWRDISIALEASYVADPGILPINTVYYIPVKDDDEGFLTAAWLNSTRARQFCREQAEHAQNGYRRYFAWVISRLPWIFDAPECRPFLPKIISLSKRCHRESGDPEALRQEIDRIIERCFAALKPHSYRRTGQQILDFGRGKADA